MDVNEIVFPWERRKPTRCRIAAGLNVETFHALARRALNEDTTLSTLVRRACEQYVSTANKNRKGDRSNG